MKKIFFIATIIICILIINALVRSIYNLWSKQDLVVEAQNTLESEKLENKKLKEQLTIVGSEEFVESEARNKLFMVKPGESGVIIPKELIKKEEKKEIVVLSNWQKWLKLFMGE